MTSLKNKKVLITGGTSGIGLGIANVFAKQDADLFLIGISPMENITKTLDDLSSLGSGSVTYEQINMCDLKSLEDHDILKNNTFDILINNAGMQYVSPIVDFPMEKYHQVMNLNLHAPFVLMQNILPMMRKNGWGRIINIASAHGLVASANKSAYCATKHGILGMTKVIALETASENITCNAICPGWVLTPLVEDQIHARAEANKTTYDEEKYLLLSEKQPSPEFTTTDSIGAMCLLLCSEAGSQMRGSCITMDAGWTAQ